MAAIRQTNVGRSNIKLTSTEFPSLSVEGMRGNARELRKKLNKMMREKRRISGGPMGKSPSKEITKDTKLGAKKEQYPASTMPSTKKPKEKKKGYQGRKSDLEFIRKNKKNKLSADPSKGPAKPSGTYGIDTGDQSLKDIIDEGVQEAGRDSQPGAVEYESGLPEEPDTQTRGLSSHPGIRRQQLAERKRKEGSKTSSLASNVIPSQKQRRTGRLGVYDRIANEREKKRIEEEARLQAGEAAITPPKDKPTSREEYVEKIKMMLTRGQLDPNSAEVRRILGDDLPTHLKRTSDYHSRHRRRSPREEYVEKVEKMIADGELDANSPEAQRILGSGGDPSPMAGPGKELEQKEVSPEKLAELDAIDKQLKEGQGEEGLIDISKKKVEQEVEQTDAKKATGEVSEEPIRYDENGYPIYHKDSKMAAAFRQAHANAPNNSEFTWNGKIYWKGGKKPEDKKDDVKAAVDVRQDYATGDANIAESLYTPQEKIENKIQKIQQIRDHHPEWSEKKKEEEIENEMEDLNKEETAELREADPNFYVDPWTGFAIDLNQLKKRRDRKDAMEMAALLPADKRATYLMQENLISKRDLKKLLEPSEMEILEMDIKKMNLDVASNNLKLSQQKLKDYRTPEQLALLQQSLDISKEKRAEAAEIRKEGRKEKGEMRGDYIKLYNNAVTNEDYEGQIFFGTQMGFPQADMQRIAEARRKLQLAEAKQDMGGSDDEFKNLFGHDYGKVLTDRKSFVFGASSVFETGAINVQFNDQTHKSRKGLLNAMGLRDWEDLIPKDRPMTDTEIEYAIGRVASMQAGQEIFDLPEYQYEDGSPNYEALLADEEEYKRFLMDNIIAEGMGNIYGSAYQDIVLFEGDLQKRRAERRKGYQSKVTSQG